MDRRLQLHNLLKTITENVYFQPPTTMAYPCIRYELDDIQVKFAGNMPYRLYSRYKATVIDRNPDSLIPKQVATMPMCTFDRFFVAENLNHFVFTLYF